MKKKIQIFPIIVSGFLSSRVANYIVEYLIPTHVNSYYQIVELILGLILAVLGIVMGYRIIKAFFDTDNLTKFNLYLGLIIYAAITGAGATWASDGLIKLVLVKYLL